MLDKNNPMLLRMPKSRAVVLRVPKNGTPLRSLGISKNLFRLIVLNWLLCLSQSCLIAATLWQFLIRNVIKWQGIFVGLTNMMEKQILQATILSTTKIVVMKNSWPMTNQKKYNTVIVRIRARALISRRGSEGGPNTGTGSNSGTGPNSLTPFWN